MEPHQLVGQANQFNEKINTIKTQFFSALDDYKKYYVYFNKNPEVNEFQNFYANSKGQIQNLSRDLFLTSNNIDKNIENLDKQIYSISLQIDDEKKLNKQLTDLINNLTNTYKGSGILIEDSKAEYNNQYYKNWQLIFGIVITGIFLGTLFKKQIPVPISLPKQ